MRLMLSLWLLLAGIAQAGESERGDLFLQRQRYASEALQLPLASGQMTVLKRPPTATSVKGHALLFADIGSDPERSARISALRHSLNELGWHTWAVVPPAQPQRAPWISPLGAASAAPAAAPMPGMAPPPPGAPGMAPPPVATPQFSYHLSVAGTNYGPYTTSQLQQYVQTGQVTRDSLLWRDGMAAWLTAGQILELAHLFAPAPAAAPPAGTPPPVAPMAPPPVN